MKFKNDLILRAAKGEKVERTPVWLMRQAGRILPEYRAIRNKLSGFKELVKTPELACEVSIQPVDILDVDAAIIFSDILVIPEAMGCNYEMREKVGPIFPKPIQNTQDVENLTVANPIESLTYVLDAIKLTIKELNGRVPLIGFSGAPWTIFAYMIEGSGSKTFSKARKFLYTKPELSHQLLQKITDGTIAYLKAQIEAGVSLVQVFDSWAGILPPNQYETFALPYLKQICNAIQNAPITIFAKGAYFALNSFQSIDCQVVGVDWNMNINEVKNVLSNKTLQGNLDPCLLYADQSIIKKETIKMLNEFGLGGKHIANLGHGVYPDTNPDNVKYFIDIVKEFSSLED